MCPSSLVIKTAGQHHVLVQFLADVNITLLDGIEDRRIEALGALSDPARVEQVLLATEAIVPKRDDVAVGERVALSMLPSSAACISSANSKAT